MEKSIQCILAPVTLKPALQGKHKRKEFIRKNDVVEFEMMCTVHLSNVWTPTDSLFFTILLYYNYFYVFRIIFIFMFILSGVYMIFFKAAFI